jgi:DNA-binding SARP family transcriptional activator
VLAALWGSAVEFRLLGPFEAIAGGATLELGGPQQRAVLALLALRVNEVVPVGSIADALWDEDPPRSAVAMVRTYTSRLRRALPAARLASRPPGYVLETDRGNVDAHRFEALVARARREGDAGRPDAASATLGEALGLWRGDVLSGLPDLARLRPEATRLEEMRLVALEDRIDAELALGRHTEVVGELEALTGTHPFRERFWGQLVVALYRSGRQTEALAAYQTLRSSLVDHAGVEPGPELRALERDVLAQAEDLRWRPPAARLEQSVDHIGAGPVPLPPAVDAATQQALVGRGRERDLVADRFERARAGRFGAVLVAGPPGIGKTALAARLARDAHAAGAAVVLGRADEGAGVPFQPLAEAIGHWSMHATADDLGRLDAPDTRALARIARAPALAEQAGPAAPTGPLPPGAATGGESGADRQRLFEAIARWFEALAADRPAVVVLEDLHWADPATLLAVRHLVRHPPAAGALLLVTHRDVDDPVVGERGEPGEPGPRREHPLRAVLAAARGQPHVARLNLAGLADGEIAELVRSETGRELDAAGRRFAGRLGRMTGGNPLFVLETLRHLTERGALAGWPGERPLAAAGVPAAVTELIDQRLRRLPPQTADVLRPASVLGEHIEVPVLSRVVGLPRIEVVEALGPALAAGLVERAASGFGGFRFSHALVRQAIVGRLPPARRARLHWDAGQALASLSASHPEPPVGEIARHLAAGVDAGDAETAIAANVRAGQRALAALAFEEALDRFRVATGLLRTAGEVDEALAYEAWFGLGQAGGVVGLSRPQRTGYLRAAAVARRRGWSDRLAVAAVGFAGYNVVHGGFDPEDEVTAARLTEDALADSAGVPSGARGLLLALKAMRAVAFEQSAEVTALAAAVQAAADADPADPTGPAAALLARAWALLGSPRPHELRDTTDRALVLAERSPFRLLLRYLLVPPLAVPPLQAGDLDGYESVRRRLGAHPEIRPEHAADNLSTWDAALALSAGRFADVERLAGTATRDYSIRRAVAAFQAGLVALERGRHDDVARWATDYSASAPTAVAPRAVMAWLRAEAGDRAGAAAWVETLRRQRPLDQLGWGAPLALRYLAEVAARTGDRPLAGDLLPVLEPYAGQMLVSYTAMTIEGAADRAIGLALLTLGRTGEAVERLAAAVDLERAAGALVPAARSACWHARALLARGGRSDAGEARRRAGDAADAARRLGLRRVEADARRLARCDSY